MRFDATTLHWLWNETTNKLVAYRQRVREHRDVQAAMEFARWVQFSGLIELFSTNAQDGPQRVDGGGVALHVKELIWECGEAFRNQSAPFCLSVSEAERLNAKLDLIAGQLSKITPPLTANTANAGDHLEPVLRVIQGGS